MGAEVETLMFDGNGSAGSFGEVGVSGRVSTCIPALELVGVSGRVSTCIPALELVGVSGRVSTCIPALERLVLMDSPS